MRQPPGAAAGDKRREARGDRTIDPFARCPIQPLDLKPLRHRLIGDGIVARMQRVRHRSPGLHPLGIVSMRCEPGVDIGATLRRQFAVDISVQLVFGDGNPRIGHGCLCPTRVENRVCITPATT